MEVAHHCPQALPHSAAGGCCAPSSLFKEPLSSLSTPSVSSDSPHLYEERSIRIADGNTQQQIESSSDDDVEPSCIRTPSQCAHHSLQHSLDQHNGDGALSLQDEQLTSAVSLAEASLSSYDGDELQQQSSAYVPSLHSAYTLDPSAYILDPSAREFIPLKSACPSPAVILQPVYAGAASVCYLASMSAMQGPCNYELVDTSLRLGLYSPASSGAPTNECIQEESSFINGENVACNAGFAGVYMGGYEHHANGTAKLLSCDATVDSLPSRTVGVDHGLAQGNPPHEGHFNPPILSLPSPLPMGFMPVLGLPASPSMPSYLPAQLPLPEYTPAIPSHQALTVYTHKHFHPYYGWKEHISRALVISGVPPYLDACHLRQELEHWGHVRAFHADRLSQGMLSVQFFDLRASRQALRDIQNQHLLRQYRFQQNLHAQNGMHFHSSMFLSGDNEDSASSRGLLCGNVVWAQYVGSSLVPCPESHNQGTLVLFNVDPDVALQKLQKVFEKYGDVREVREAPTKRQHKFVEYYDTRDAETAWATLNGQEVCGKWVKIEFSRQGGSLKKQTNVQSVRSCLDMAVYPLPHMQQIDGLSDIDPASCGWQGHNSQGLYQQEWHAGGNTIMPFPNRSTTVLPNSTLGPAGASSSCRGRYLKRDRGCVVTHMQGTVAGPRRKQSGIARSPLKMYHVVVREPARGTDGAFAALPASAGRCGAIKKNLNLKGHPQFEYDETEVISKEPRTTLMIKNIPNKYSQQMLLSLLDHHCVEYNSQIVDLNEPESAYDFVYLPIDFKNRCNLGYAFVNFTTALATLKFYKAFHAQQWEAFNSRKVCEIKYARVQGRRALENHFCNSRFACDTMEFLPVAFVPPRNGFVCPFPTAAAGLMATKSCERSVHRSMPMQALLGPPPSPCKLLSEGYEVGKFMPESKCLLENATLPDTESAIEDDKHKHDIEC